MSNLSTPLLRRIGRLLPVMLPIIAAIFSFQYAKAFDTAVYTDTSRLATGQWVRVTVDRSGLYMITNAELRRYGFNDPSKVAVYGYGATRRSDHFLKENYIDDLVAAPFATTAKGVVFWAYGPEKWSLSSVPEKWTHELNPYTTTSSYFLTEVSEVETMKVDGRPEGSDGVRVFTEKLYHESELYSPGKSGHLLVGEDFRFNKTQQFSFPVPGIVAGSTPWINVRFALSGQSNASLAFSVNGANGEKINLANGSANSYAAITTHSWSAEPVSGQSLNLGITFSGDGSALKGAWLDAISVNYQRALALTNGSLAFSQSASALKLDVGGANNVEVWDVTDPKDFFKVATTPVADGAVSWTKTREGERAYAAFTAEATLPAPVFAERVDNQNIHGAQLPDMVIVTCGEWKQYAERLADYHRNSADSLRTLVVTDRQVFNEFSSGNADAAAIRRMMKMFWDRGTSEDGHRLQYLLLMGRATHDNRLLTADMKALRQNILPCWQTDDGLRENSSYMSDDYFSFLEDGSGLRMAADKLCIGVGRLPIGNVAEARSLTEKILNYYATVTGSAKSGMWKNHVILTADDGDNGIHMTQAENQYDFMMASAGGRNMTYSKVYIDAFDEVGGESVVGRNLLHKRLREGVAWWNYIGHGNTQRLGSEGLIIYNDLSTMTSRYPAFFYGATCSFLRWDGPEKSACEIMLHNPDGGIIGAICPTREVYISENAYITDAVGRAAFSRDANGRAPRVGDIMRMAKNDLKSVNGAILYQNDNKLRFVLMADPAMRLPTPEPLVVLERVNGMRLDDESVQPTMMARQRVNIEGYVADQGTMEPLTDFDGTLSIQLFDAEESVTTQGRPSDDTYGERITYQQQGALLFAGSDSIKAGRFSVEFNMPGEIADNFRPAALNMYARSRDNREAAGVSRDFYVYGYDDTADADTIPPMVEFAYLNHSSFTNGDKVNPSPMFIAGVKDNVGINLSTAGVGHQMTIKIDGRDSYTDISSYYTPSSDGTPSGSVAYPLTGLTEGPHQLSFRVWDTAGNSATHTFNFDVVGGLAPTLYDVYTDANPASTQANFYLSHNRPDQNVTVTIEVFNLNGRLEWSTTASGQSDMFLSSPITWNLCNNAGHRLNRGIYLYRATVEADGTVSKSITKRIAVTAP